MGDHDARLLAKCVALANAALPDGDPRKLTREDVKLVREMAHFAVQGYESHGMSADDLPADAAALAAKLAALLPPDDATP